MAKHDLDRVFQALSDATRRDIVQRLSRQDAMTVSSLAAGHDMALPSFMKHIAALEACGLIRTARHGRVRLCRIVPERLADATGWIAAQRAAWAARTDRLADYVENPENWT